MTDEQPTGQQQDWADLHVERWRDHWVLDEPFDDETEAIFIRMGRLGRHLQSVKRRAAAQAGLAEYEYDTLHVLMIRDTPGTASPTELARDLDITGAGMTGRLDSMERAGWLRRTTLPDDRRRVAVEITPAGTRIWRAAMSRRGHAEDELTGLLSGRERTMLADLLKRMTLTVEGEG